MPTPVKMYAIYLSVQGIRVAEAPDVEQALEQAKVFLPDVITTSMGVDFGGVSLCHRLKDYDTTKGIPVIAVTGRAMPQEGSVSPDGRMRVCAGQTVPAGDAAVRDQARAESFVDTLHNRTSCYANHAGLGRR